MARIGLFDCVNGQRPDGVDTPLVEVALACGAAGVLSGSGLRPGLGAHDAMPVGYAESPLNYAKRLSGQGVPAFSHFQ